ncbi:hypothetical protein [Nocardia sp. BMG111209]|uniref:hypothetical protein n=1 Tax=Nocardia sp. BMG111209 TaxID=1160137 RepID=UPI0012DE90BD|nr:hypothetical protein [Nocardia sp. BMG111209]
MSPLPYRSGPTERVDWSSAYWSCRSPAPPPAFVIDGELSREHELEIARSVGADALGIIGEPPAGSLSKATHHVHIV